MVRLLKDPTIQVIAVVGMGGSGKTFLLQNVYKAVKSQYDHSIWLSISKSYSLKDLQRDIASKIDPEKNSSLRDIVEGNVTEERAAEVIHDHLQGKRSFIVLDDLWMLSTENSLIDRLGLATDKYCKVVVSTRNRQVALNSRAEIYDMQNLSDEDSWTLFCFYAFLNRGPLHMEEEEGRKIIKQYGNLPLAIKTIAASLANTTDLSKWEFKRRQLKRVVTPIGDPDPIMEILKLSYDSLPAQLKPCFAYFSFFPENVKIDPEYLIYLWIGEGFIPAGEEQWDMAWDWLNQLAQLCLLQLCERVDSSYVTKFCTIHDLLHDLAIQISKENKCVFSVEEVSTHTSGAASWRRILLAKKDLHVNDILDNRPVCLRTLSLSQKKEITSISENLFTAMRGLRVLDLSSTKISTLPESVGKMILLKVLNLRNKLIEQIPECVRHLKSLLFLALHLSCNSLPVWISELRCLQHLEVQFNFCYVPKGISELASLRTLRSGWLWLSIEENEFLRLEDFVDMTQLQELCLTILHEIELKRMEEGILAQLVNMRRLKTYNGMTEFAQFSEKMRAMKHLERLVLFRFLVPSSICELAELRELSLFMCECSDYPELQRMPNLVRLYLRENRSCRELLKSFGKSTGFPKLRFLQIERFF